MVRLVEKDSKWKEGSIGCIDHATVTKQADYSAPTFNGLNSREMVRQATDPNFEFPQLAEINRHVWVTAAGKGELELELSMMDVVQTHVIPSVEAIDPDVLQAIASLGCFKERDKLIQELLSPK